MTVSHRQTLWPYHDYMLRFNGDKDYEFGEIEKTEEGIYQIKKQAAIQQQE